MAEQGYIAWLNSPLPSRSVDPAKPASDKTVICATDHSGVGYIVFKDQPQTIARMPLSPQAVDHTWDMLVLAARSSRYGE